MHVLVARFIFCAGPVEIEERPSEEKQGAKPLRRDKITKWTRIWGMRKK